MSARHWSFPFRSRTPLRIETGTTAIVAAVPPQRRIFKISSTRTPTDGVIGVKGQHDPDQFPIMGPGRGPAVCGRLRRSCSACLFAKNEALLVVAGVATGEPCKTFIDQNQDDAGSGRCHGRRVGAAVPRPESFADRGCASCAAPGRTAQPALQRLLSDRSGARACGRAAVGNPLVEGRAARRHRWRADHDQGSDPHQGLADLARFAQRRSRTAMARGRAGAWRGCAKRAR